MAKLRDINERFPSVLNARSNLEKLNTSYFGMRSMTWTHWILLISIMLQHAMVLCVDALWILCSEICIQFHVMMREREPFTALIPVALPIE